MSQSSPSPLNVPSVVICAETEPSASAGCVTSGQSPDLSEWDETLPARLLVRTGSRGWHHLFEPPPPWQESDDPSSPALSPSYRLKAAVSAGRLEVQEPQSSSRSPQRGILLRWSTLRLGARLALGSPEAPSPFIHCTLGMAAILLCPDLLPRGRWRGCQ